MSTSPIESNLPIYVLYSKPDHFQKKLVSQADNGFLYSTPLHPMDSNAIGKLYGKLLTHDGV